MARQATLTSTLIAATFLLAPAMAQAQSRPNALNWGFTSDIETMEPYSTAKRTSQLVIRNVLEHLAFRDPKTG
jgi:peptide/nickel transport system substrate-binding protein